MLLFIAGVLLWVPLRGRRSRGCCAYLEESKDLKLGPDNFAPHLGVREVRLRCGVVPQPGATQQKRHPDKRKQGVHTPSRAQPVPLVSNLTKIVHVVDKRCRRQAFTSVVYYSIPTPRAALFGWREASRAYPSAAGSVPLEEKALPEGLHCCYFFAHFWLNLFGRFCSGRIPRFFVYML